MRGWRTLAVNATAGLSVIAVELLAYLEAVTWEAILPPGRAAYVVIGIGLANIFLRHVTTGPAGWRIRNKD